MVRRLELPFRDVDWTRLGRAAATRPQAQATTSTIALVGKYIDLPDAYLSVTEALRAGGFANDAKVDDPLGRLGRLRRPARVRPRARAASTAICVPGGFGVRGIEGKLGALRYAREQQASRRSACAWACSAW